MSTAASGPMGEAQGDPTAHDDPTVEGDPTSKGDPTADGDPTAQGDPTALADGSQAWLTIDEPISAARVAEVTTILGELVSGGAALGWVSPPGPDEVRTLLDDVSAAAGRNDARLVWALDDSGAVLGLGYWERYPRPTRHPHADLQKLAVGTAHQGRGIGRSLLSRLVAEATEAGIELLTLDARGDNEAALRLYAALGFAEYGRLADFVAVGDRRYPTVFLVRDLRRSEHGPTS